MTRDLFFGICLGLIIMYILMEIRDHCLLRPKTLEDHIQILARQSSRWATAAKQDKNSMVAVIHANYGAGYLWALKDIATDEQIKATIGIDMKKFTKEIVDIQDQATVKMASLCPKYAPDPSYLTKIGREGV